MSSETIPVRLDTDVEREALLHLLDSYPHDTCWEAVQHAYHQCDLEDAAARTLRLAGLREACCDDGTIPAVDRGAYLLDLHRWADEAESAINEHLQQIGEEREREDLSEYHRQRKIHALREGIIIAHAHAGVCRRLIAQIERHLRQAAVAA